MRTQAECGTCHNCTSVSPRHPQLVACTTDEPAGHGQRQRERVPDADGPHRPRFFCGIITKMLGYDRARGPAEAIRARSARGSCKNSSSILISNQIELPRSCPAFRDRTPSVLPTRAPRPNERADDGPVSRTVPNHGVALRNSYHGHSFGAIASPGTVRWKSRHLLRSA